MELQAGQPSILVEDYTDEDAGYELNSDAGLDPDQAQIDPQAVYNRTQGKPLSKGWVFGLTRNRFYRDRVMPTWPGA